MDGPILSAVRPRQWRTFVSGVIVGGVVVSAGWFAYDFKVAVERIFVTENGGQALFRVCKDLDVFMAAHQGRWPTGWDDLERTRRGRDPTEVARMAADEAAVEVDWSFDPARLRGPSAGGGGGFRAVWLRSDAELSNGWMDPNNWLDDGRAQTRPATATAPS